MKSRYKFLADWVLPLSGPPIRYGAVLVEEGRISYVGPRDQAPVTEGVEVLEWRESLLMPGFVNAHTHLAYSAMKGQCDLSSPLTALNMMSRAKDELSDEGLQVAILSGVREAINSGMTTLATSVNQSKLELLNVCEELGMRTLGYLSIKNKNTVEIDIQMLEKLRNRFQDSDLIRIGIMPHSLYNVSPIRLKEICRYGKANGYPISMHLAELVEEVKFFRRENEDFSEITAKLAAFYESEISRPTSATEAAEEAEVLGEGSLMVHCIHCDEEDAFRLARNGNHVVICPKSSLRLGTGFPPLEMLRQAGINVCFGTDGIATCDVFDMFEEMRFAALSYGFIPGKKLVPAAEWFVQATTQNGAKAIGMEEEIGTLEVGKRADLIAVHLGRLHTAGFANPYEALVYACRADDVQMTMVEGKILKLNKGGRGNQDV